MTDTLIKLRRSAVPGKIPTDAQLQLGEVAINTYDGKMFFKQSAISNTILQVATTSLDLSQFATTTSAQLASVISNETGAGSLVFGTSPTLVTPVINGNTTFDSGTLFIDSVNNRVGVNTISPTQALHVVGNARITGGIADSNGNFGTPGQVLASNTSGIYWVTSAAVGTDLSTTYANDAVTVNSSTGTNALIIAANGINAGVMSAPDKVKLNGIEAGAQVNVPTNLSIGSSTGTVVRIDSSTGTNATLPVASATLAGVVTNAAQTFAGVKTFNSTISGSISGNAGTATTLQTARTLWGQSFDGSNNVTGSLTFVGNITGAGAMTIAPGANTSVTFSTSGTAGFTSIINTTPLGGTLNDSLRIRRILGRLTNNSFYSDIYLRRDATGTDWTTARWHDAVGVDSSFLTPGVDTRVWYERDPNNEIHEWGTRNETSMLLDSSATANASKLTVNGTISFGTQANKATITYTTNTARTYTIPNVAASDFVMAAGDQSIGGIKTFTSNPVISGTAPVLEFYESDQAADNQRWFARSEGSNFTIQAVTDAGSGGENLWRFTRSGNQVTALEGTVSGSPAISLTNASRSLTFTGGVGTIGTTDAQSLQLNTNGTTKVTINSSGNVGIGTTASDIVPGFNRFIAIGDSDTGIGQISDGILAFATNFSEKMRITGGGNVGIGVSSPTEKLHVEGNARALSFASANGSVSAPAYDFAADTNTGMFLAAADTIGFATNGTTAAQFTPTGNLRLFNTAGNCYTEISNQPTANNTLTLPNSGNVTLVSGTMATTDTSQTISGAKTFTQNVVISSDSTGTLTLNRSTDDKYVGTTYTTAGTARWLQYIANTAAADMIFQSRDAAGAVIGAALVLRNSSQRTDAIGTLGIFGGGGGTYFTNITNPALSANRTLTLADGNTTLVSGTMVPTTGTGATGTWGISVSGSAATPIFSSDVATRDNLTTRVNSGFYQTANGTIAEGWPKDSNSYQYLLSVTHNNTSNYYALQIAAPFYSQELFFRNTNGSGTQSWSTILHSGNYNTYSPTLTGTGATGTWGISVTGNAATVTNGVYTTGNQIIDGAKTFTTAINSERPTDFWTSNAGTYYKVSNLGGLSTEGGFAVSITSNGYRKNDATWQSYGANGLNGASQITLNPNGNIYFRTDTTLASGNTQIAPTIRATINGSGNMGIGTQSPAAQLHLYGTGQTSAALMDAGDRGGMIRVSGVGSAAGTGGAILFASQQSETVGSLGYAAIRGLLANGSANTIGHLGFYTRNATTDNQLIERMRLTNSGSIGIGLTNPSTILHASGEITATDFNTTSDINVKKNIEPIDNAIFKISQINGVTFSFIDDPDEQRHAGVIAQDVEKVLPEAVKELGSGVKHVAYGNLIGLLVEAIKEQQKQIDELKALINK